MSCRGDVFGRWCCGISSDPFSSIFSRLLAISLPSSLPVIQVSSIPSGPVQADGQDGLTFGFARRGGCVLAARSAVTDSITAKQDKNKDQDRLSRLYIRRHLSELARQGR